ncbi:MAG TPA: hypothetical protein EYP57_04650 [Thermodesulfobacteriaceae bacterium]|nr:hypothetical protein [Thermodesulfobacteriaceae bacterium]
MNIKGIDISGLNQAVACHLQSWKKETRQIKPVKKSGKAAFRTLSDDNDTGGKNEQGPDVSYSENKCMVSAIQTLRQELQSCMDIEICSASDSRQPLIEIRDTKTGKTVKQIPPEDILSSRDSPNSDILGLLLDKKV